MNGRIRMRDVEKGHVAVRKDPPSFALRIIAMMAVFSVLLVQSSLQILQDSDTILSARSSAEFFDPRLQGTHNETTEVFDADEGTLIRRFLSVPFYVYEELAWENATFGPSKISDLASGFTKFQKHSDDYWLMKASLRHPMRTFDPSKAKLFFVPMLLNFFAFRANPQLARTHSLCWNHICDEELLVYTEEVLRSSPWIHANPERHLVVASHFFARADEQFWHAAPPIGIPEGLRDILYQCNMVSFETAQLNHPNRLRMPKIYVGNPCKAIPLASKSQDVAMIATIPPEEMRPQFKDRRRICRSLRWAVKYNQSSPPIHMTHCGGRQTHWADDGDFYLEQFPALAESRFGFHVRGDTWGSSRLFDTLLSGTVPIFTRIEQFSVLPAWIDWNKISYFLNMEDAEDPPSFIGALEPILRDEAGYFSRYQAIMQLRNYFDHRTIHPLDLYLYILQANLYPATRHQIDHGNSVPALLVPQPTISVSDYK